MLRTALLVLFVSTSGLFAQPFYKTQLSAQPLTRENLLDVVFMRSFDSGWAVGKNGLVIRTTDGGLSWMQQNVGATPGAQANLTGVALTSSATLFSVSDSGTIRWSYDGGVIWNIVHAGTAPLHAIDLNSPLNEPTNVMGLAVGQNGLILKGGIFTGWLPQTSGTTATLRGVHLYNRDTMFVVGDGGTFRRSTQFGEQWVERSTSTTKNLNAVRFATGSTGWIVGDSGTILKTVDAGDSWTSQTSGTTLKLRHLHFVSATTGWITGDSGLVLSTSNGGTTWTRRGATSGRNVNAVFSIAGLGVAVGDSGLILRSDFAGTTWTPVKTSRDLLRSLHFSGADTGVAVGQGGVVLTTRDRGVTWTRREIAGRPDLNVVHLVGKTGWATGTKSSVYVTKDAGETWTAQTEPNTTYGFRGMSFVDTTRGFFAGDNGTVFRTQNGGVDWLGLNVGTNAALNAVHFRHADTGWVAGATGTIMKTVDGGNNWTAQQTGTTETLNGLAFLNGRAGIAGGSGGMILKTTNGGTNWNTASSLLPGTVKLVTFAGNPPVAVAIGEGFQAVSLDTGLTWRTTSLGDTILGGVTGIASHQNGSLWIAKANGSIITNTLLALTGVGGGLNGGLSARVGDTVRIQVGHKDIAQVTLQFSADSGATWSPIGVISPTGNLSLSASSLAWAVPNTLTTKGRFRAFNSNRPSEADTLAGTFSILPALVPTLALTSPTASTSWVGATVQNITWTATHIDTVTLQYSYNGTQWFTLAPKVLASTGTVAWTVPDTSSTTVKVRVATLKNPALADTSDAFTTTKTVVGLLQGAGAPWFGITGYIGLTGSVGQIRFQLATPASSVTVSVRDLGGKVVARSPRKSLDAGRHIAELDVSHLPAGTYLCELLADEARDTRRIMRLK